MAQSLESAASKGRANTGIALGSALGGTALLGQLMDGTGIFGGLFNGCGCNGGGWRRGGCNGCGGNGIAAGKLLHYLQWVALRHSRHGKRVAMMQLL